MQRCTELKRTSVSHKHCLYVIKCIALRGIAFLIYASASSVDNRRILNQPVDVHCFDLGVLVLP